MYAPTTGPPVSRKILWGNTSLDSIDFIIPLQTPCIEQLDARNTGLTEQVMPMLGRALRLGSQLTVLHLESAILSGRPLMILGNCLTPLLSSTALVHNTNFITTITDQGLGGKKEITYGILMT